MIPGKRESRRFEGDYMLNQKDVVDQREHTDVVSFGGWALDLHPADGVYSDQPGCTQWHAKGVYQIPFRTLYSRNIKNLFLGGRLISASHVAFGSTRVMATCAHTTQAVATAAFLCVQHQLKPSDLLQDHWMKKFQSLLIKQGQYLPKIKFEDKNDLAKNSKVSVSSQYGLRELPFDGRWKSLEFSMAQLIPIPPGNIPIITIKVRAKAKQVLQAELRVSQKTGNYTPDQVLEKLSIPIKEGENFYQLSFNRKNDNCQYFFICLMANDSLEVQCSDTRLTGLISVFNKFNKAVATSSTQNPPPGIGIDSFEFWVPQRRPNGHNLAFRLDQTLNLYAKENLFNGVFRPFLQPNAWVANLEDEAPYIQLDWENPQELSEVVLYFDTDMDHPLESTLLGHPESEIPFCVKSYRIKDDKGKIVYCQKDNHQTINLIRFDQLVKTRKLLVELDHPSPTFPAALFGILCYGKV
jgi:hypothetical protein